MQIFGKILIPIIILFIALAIVKKILEDGLKDKNKDEVINKDKENIKQNNKELTPYIIIILTISIIIYSLLMSKIMAFMSIRYYLLILPSIMIMLTYILKYISETLIDKEVLRISIIVLLVLGYMMVSLSVAEKNEFLYKGSNKMYKEIENTNVKDIIYYYKYFYEVNNDLPRYINNNIYYSEIDKIEDENSSSIEEIKKRDKINIYIHNNEKSNIDKILQKLNNDYKIIKQTDNFYGTVYTISK